MFNQGGLSLEQAPPISVVLRFFVTGALFGIGAGLSLLFFGSEALQPQTPQALVLTHILTLGVMASFMLGALFQMLPVIAGVVLQNPTRKATFVHLTFTLGVLALLYAFDTQKQTYFTAAGILLAISLLYATLLMLLNLTRLQNHSPSSRGMLVALAAFVVTLLLALYLLGTLAGWHAGTAYTAIKTAHYTFGLLGWIALLILSISFQVVEMFYVTPPFPRWMMRYLTTTLFCLLLIKAALLVGALPTLWVDGILALLYGTYALVTLHRLQKRKRPTSDATVWFWRLGMGMLLVTMLLWLLTRLLPNTLPEPLLYLTFTFFVLSVLFAMVYKIVPFLVWFHLSNQGYMGAPMMHDIIHPKRVKIHFYLHALHLMVWLATLLYPPLLYAAAALTILSFGWLLYHLLYAVYLYRHTQKHQEKISW